MDTLTKAELINAISERVDGVSKADVTRIVHALQDVIIDTVASGSKVSLTGFASFEPYTTSERNGRNPRTGETIVIPERPSVRIKPLKSFKDRLAS